LKEQSRQNALLWKFRRTSAKEGGDNTIVLNYSYSLEGAFQERQNLTFAVDLPDRIHVTASPPQPIMNVND